MPAGRATATRGFEFHQTSFAENEAKIDQLLEIMTLGGVSGDLLAMMNEKATELKLERERLRTEQRKLNEQLTPLDHYVDALPLRQVLSDFSKIAHAAEPVKLQRLMRTMI